MRSQTADQLCQLRLEKTFQAISTYGLNQTHLSHAEFSKQTKVPLFENALIIISLKSTLWNAFWHEEMLIMYLDNHIIEKRRK